MRRGLIVLMALAALLGILLGRAHAWQCPVQWKSAEEAIRKAEAMPLTPEAKGLVADAKRLVAESKKHHQDGNAKIDHAHSMWKAKAAQAQAEAAQILSIP